MERHQISLGGIDIVAYNYDERFKESPYSGKSLLVASFEFEIRGMSINKRIIDALAGKEITFKINDNTRKMRRGPWSWHYVGAEQTDLTVYTHQVELEEIDPDEPEKWSPLAASFEALIMNRIRIRAISELLEEKGIFEKGEYDNRINEVEEREYEKFRKLLLEGPPDWGKKSK